MEKLNGSKRINIEKPLALSLYRAYPGIEIPLDKFQDLAAERLQVLMWLEDARTRSLLRGDDLRLKLTQLVSPTHLAVRDYEQKQNDLISHWVLSVAFSGNEELRRRFVQFELDLFKVRFQTMLPSEIKKFVDEEKLNYQPMTEAERDNMIFTVGDSSSNPLDDLHRNNFGKETPSFSSTQFYKVPFTQVPDLLSKRRVFVSKGIAYVTHSDLISAVSWFFESELRNRLEIAARSLSWAVRDDRVGPLINKLQTASIGNDMSNTGVSSRQGSVRLSDLPVLSKRSFPLCAAHLNSSLMKDHHLKHLSRLQLTLFLKGIGLTMEDTVTYLQSQFAQKGTTPEEFRKKGYLYSIKHAFGQEGKRANYAPWSCAKATSHSQTTSDQRHGCPFKEFTSERIAIVVREGQVTEPQIREIVELVKGNHYQLACRKHWEALHPKGNADAVGNHPNQWFEESMKYYDEKDKAAKAEAEAKGSAEATTPTVPATTTTLTET